MSRVTFRPDISGSILAGARLAALADELKFNKLQRAEFEATAQHRELLRTLEVEKSRAALSFQSLQSQLLAGELEDQKATSGARREKAALEPKLLESQIAQAGAGAEQTRALTEESRSRAAGNLVENRGRVLANILQEQQIQQYVGKAAGGTGQAFTDDDFTALAQSAMNANGVQYKPGDAVEQLWTQGIKASALEMQRELEQTKQANVLDGAVRTATLAQNLAEAAMRTGNPRAAIEALGDSFGDNPQALKAARQLVEGGLRSRAEEQASLREPRDDEFSKGLKEELTLIVSGIAELEARQDTGETLSRRDKKNLETSRAKAKRLQDQLEAHFGAKRPERRVEDAVTSPFKPAGVDVEPPRISTALEFSKLPSGTVYIDARDGKRYRKP